MKTRLHPLDKPFFLESINQKWCAIYTVIGLGVMMASAYGLIHDPAPFLGYFTGIGVTFILGASGSDIMKAYKVESYTDSETQSGGFTYTPAPKDVDDGSIS